VLTIDIYYLHIYDVNQTSSYAKWFEMTEKHTHVTIAETVHCIMWRTEIQKALHPRGVENKQIPQSLKCFSILSKTVRLKVKDDA
jgi:hypothetical protein